ncbi:hypothetical protein TARUN_6083 [Trichoderma arundinaceum]|uniref:Uncharacterized protein n=1 Tax=Trichoderma arundinaceum TaxID=490622 RepID=A0A395NJS4_TRIAR|nr:hypothetical protein TARUN_6083 [Trichoderma arundinaceum]
MASKHLSFVNISHPDEGRSRDVKASVRRHVMADIGRSRRKRAKYRIITLQITAGETAPDAKPVNTTAVEPTPIGRMPPSFQTFLVNSDARACELINFMAAEADYTYRPFRTSWFKIGLSDSTAFDLWLAQAVVIRNSITNEDTAASPWAEEYLDSLEANKYYFKSLNQLAHRLSNRDDCMSNGVIATIMGFICVDTRVGSWDRFSVHMDGLERIYKLRNGFDGLDSEIPLMTFWVDLMGASMLDRYPRFPMPTHLNNSPRVTCEDDVPRTLRTLLRRAERVAPQGKRIYTMLQMMAPVVAMVNREANDPLFWTQYVFLVEELGAVSHFVLSVPKSPEDDMETGYSVFLVQRMVQLACLMIISELKRQAYFHWADMGLLRDRLVSLLRGPHYKLPAELEMLRLWAIVTAQSLTLPELQESFLVEARRSMIALGYNTAEQAIECAKGIIWLESINPIAWGSLVLSCDV